MKLEVRSQKSEVVFVMGIRATIQKHFALKVLALNPIILVNSVISYQLSVPQWNREAFIN